MSEEEIAVALVEKLMPDAGVTFQTTCAKYITTALRTARNEALEEAAKLADVEASTGEYTGDLAREGQHRNMAIRIRQLKHKDGQP